MLKAYLQTVKSMTIFIMCMTVVLVAKHFYDVNIINPICFLFWNFVQKFLLCSDICLSIPHTEKWMFGKFWE